MNQPLETAAAYLKSANKIVVFAGAGASAESGTATFRDALTGLWKRFDAQRLATTPAFKADPSLVWGWYEWRKVQAQSVRPNSGHVAVAQLARLVSKQTIVTQNVDSLHERAGSDCLDLQLRRTGGVCWKFGAAPRGILWQMDSYQRRF